MLRVALFLATNFAILIVASFTLNLLGLGSYMTQQGLNYESLLVFCFIFGMGGAFVSLFLSKWMAKRGMRVKTIEQPSNATEKWLVDTVGELAQKANIGMPEVGVFHSDAPNAFATGWNKNNSLVAVSTGLLQSMNQDEVKAVLGHEVGHVANGDMVTLTLIQGVVNAFVMFFARIIGSFVDRVVFKNENGHGLGFIFATMFAEIILGFLASTIVFWFSRRREFRADVAGAELVDPRAMVSALQRLKGGYAKESEMPGELVAFGISGELKHKLGGLFMTHPPLDDRIRALKTAYNV